MFMRIEWKVPNCSKESIRKYEVGKTIESGTFKVCNGNVITQCYIRFYPNGDCIGAQSFVSLFLGLRASNSKDFRIAYKFGVKGRTELDNHMGTEFSDLGEEFKDNSTWGCSKFLSWDKLFNPADRYIINEEITVICEIFLKANEQTKTGSSISNNMLLNYKNSFEEGLFADLKLKMIDGEVFKAHRLVLATQSKVFHAMFTNDCKEAKEGVVEISDIDSRVMKEALRFMYYGEVENLNEIAEDLIFAAEKYELDELKEKCNDSLVKLLTTENVLRFLVISDKVSGAEKLFDICIDEIMSHYDTIKNTLEWKNLSKNLMVKAMDQIIHLNNRIYI